MASTQTHRTTNAKKDAPQAQGKEQRIPLSKIDISCQVRDVQGDVLEDYAERMQAGDKFPPLVVYRDAADKVYLADGFHIWYARRSLGERKATCLVLTGEKRDAVLHAAGANRAHGLRRSNADKRRAVLTLLEDEEWSGWADRKISEYVGVSHTFVAKVREAKTTGNGCQCPRAREGADGRTTDTTNIGTTQGKREHRRPHGSEQALTAESNKTTESASRKMSQPLATHVSSQSDEWFTPVEYIDAAREVFGGTIDLDPASCAEANKTVKANEFFTQERNGLQHPWKAQTAFVNPPYCGETDKWVAKLINEYEEQHLGEAILLVNACTSRVWFRQLWQFPLCFPKTTLHFVPGDGRETSGAAPTASVFAYLGPNRDRFERVFSKFGHVGILTREETNEAQRDEDPSAPLQLPPDPEAQARSEGATIIPIDKNAISV